MELPPFAVKWLRASWEAHEAAISTPRKNGKSAIAAVLALGYLVGPLRRPGWRGAIASVNKEKANELRKQVHAIAVASGLDLRVRRSPYPGVVESPSGTLDTLSADRTAGHAAGYDLVLVDETGLFPLRARDLLAGLRSSVSAKGGQIRHISIRGDSPLFAEILDNPAIVSHVYAAPDDCAIDDPAVWASSNPGLGLVKQITHLRAEVERVKGCQSDEPAFRSLELNQAISPTREMICSPSDLEQCFTDDLEMTGVCFVAFDIGESQSGTSACAYWPESGAMRTWLSFGDKPTLTERGKRDGADYVAMERRGELKTYVGRVVPVEAFIADVRADLAGAHVRSAVADAHRLGEVLDCLPWPLTVVRSGAGPDGSQSVRSFQRAVLTKTLKLKSNLSLSTAIKESTLTRGRTGMPTVDKERSRGRIDTLSAAVLAVGVGAKYRPPPPLRFVVAR